MANPTTTNPLPLSDAWPRLLADVLARGREVSPRGMRTLELPQHTVEVDARRPVLLVPERRLSYQFMAAEAYWILSGSDLLADIMPWGEKTVARFSDDGVRFFGAYGPKVVGQLDYVVAKLLEDPDSRQAGLTIWRESPPKTKDVPCTVAMFFSLRGGPRGTLPTGFAKAIGAPLRLETNVFMRSNDVWLGTPYDAFNFSMVAHLVCARLNQALGRSDGRPIEPSVVRLTAASSHLYKDQWDVARAIASDHNVHSHGASLAKCRCEIYRRPIEAPTPEGLWTDARALRQTLEALRHTKAGDPLRWWEGAEP